MTAVPTTLRVKTSADNLQNTLDHKRTGNWQVGTDKLNEIFTTYGVLFIEIVDDTQTNIIRGIVPNMSYVFQVPDGLFTPNKKKIICFQPTTGVIPVNPTTYHTIHLGGKGSGYF